MSKNIRIRTKVGVDRNLRVKIDQDFDFLEILSLKLRQEDVYSRFCSDYGVITGRVIANGGFGVPNANISVFVPLDAIDEYDPVISTLYPYKTPHDKNEDGYRYNLLPYKKESVSHVPTGTFPDREDILTRKEVLEIYEKYYKYTVKTNSSGDFMIVGVPLGQQKVVMDLDLSNIGQFSLRPIDLIRMGKAVQTEFDGQFFRASENLDALPQIVHDVVDVDVSSFWGDGETCDVGITRVDFDLRELGYEIQPTAIFMGSMFSTNEKNFLKSNCKPKPNTGNLCDSVTQPGQILSIRQTIDLDENGDPILEQYKLLNNGNVIDDDGTWMVDVPMNLDYLTTNEFGETIISNDPDVGVPTKGKYRFKIKWQSESGLKASILRANYLVPNIRENWTGSNSRPSEEFMNKSYAFSVNWDDYYDKNAAINCEDTFYSFTYNKVYTVASHIDRFKFGQNRSRHLGIKEINDNGCISEINRFPVNDGVRNFDFLFFLFNMLLRLTMPTIITVLPLVHVLAFLWPFLRLVLNIIIAIIKVIVKIVCWIKNITILGAQPFSNLGGNNLDCENEIPYIPDDNPFADLTLPMITFPDCEACNCDASTLEVADGEEFEIMEATLADINNVSSLSNVNDIDIYKTLECRQCGEGITSTNTPPINYAFDAERERERNQAYAGCNITNNIPENNAIGQGAAYNRWFMGPAYPIHQWTWFAPDPVPEGFEGYDCLQSKKTWKAGSNPTFPQVLNSMNQRARYFNDAHNGGTNERQNIIKGQITNSTGDGSIGFGGGPGTGTGSGNLDYWTDLPLLLFVDETVDWQPGQLMTFHDPDSINDPYLEVYSGGTNGFGRNGKTGNTIYSLENGGTFVKTFNFVDEHGIEQTCQVNFFNTASTTDYKFTCGIEYFQVITGYTTDYIINELIGNTQTYRDRSILHNHLFGSYQRTVCWGMNALPSDIQNNLCQNSGILSLLVQNENASVGMCRFNKDVINGFENMKLYILTRGVDPHSPRQKIRFNVSRLFGAAGLNNDGYSNWNNNPKYRIEGDFYMNIPIQKHDETHDSIQPGQRAYLSPVALYNLINDYYYESNNTIQVTTNPSVVANKCFHDSFTFPIGWSDAFISTGFTNYSSMDRTIKTSVNGAFNNNPYAYAGEWALDFNCVNDREYAHGNYLGFPNSGNHLQGGAELAEYNYFGRVEGGSMQFNGQDIYIGEGLTNINQVGTISPSYIRDGDLIPHTNMYSNKVFRTDRLPTSDSIFLGPDGTTRFFQRYCLHLNPNFRIYLLDDFGDVTSVSGGATGTQSTPSDASGNLDDMADELPTVINEVLDSFTCAGMVSLNCYEGSGESFGVLSPCVIEEGLFGSPMDYDVRVVNGCYVFVKKPYIFSLFKDYKLLFEYKTRLRILFAMCRGVLSEVFQNNWVNGTLYMPSFQKKTIYSSDNEVIAYRYCGSITEDGPLYFNTETNSFFYRSAPYYNGNFVGQSPSQLYDGANKKNIWFPTTITDLGPREELLKEVILLPEFQSFIMDKLQSSSYEDTSDILNIFLLARLVNANVLEQILGLGDASVNQLFSRDESGLFRENRVDADYAQMISINSEFGVLPYLAGNYADSVTVSDDRIGIWFDSDLIDRKILNPGITTFGNDPLNSPTNYFGYTSSQIVPYYKWEIVTNNGLFGTELNNWKTDQIFSTNYQTSPFGSSSYMVPQNGPAYGYIYNASASDPELDTLPGNGSKIKVGSPYHFYFGLKRGKSALNKFLTEYLFLDV